MGERAKLPLSVLIGRAFLQIWTHGQPTYKVKQCTHNDELTAVAFLKKQSATRRRYQKRLRLVRRHLARTFSPVTYFVYRNLQALHSQGSRCECYALCDWCKWPPHPVRSRVHLASRPSPNLSSGPGSHCLVHTQILQTLALEPI